MLAFMLDTNVCIEVIRRRPLHLQQRFNRHAGTLCISTITLAELHYGAEKSADPTRNQQVLTEFAARLVVLPFTDLAARHHGQIRAELSRAGQLCGPYDLLIGGHARSEDLTVVTDNLREFTRMSGLRCESWTEENLS